MSTYFKDEYKKYYEKLNNSSLTTKASDIQNKSSLLIPTMNRLKNRISEFSWNELYYTELKNNVIPSFKKRIEIFVKNIEDGLVQVANSLMNELLPKLRELKTTDEEYDSIVSYLSNNQNANNISIYTNKKSSSEKKLIELSKEIDSIISKIKEKNTLQELNYVDASISISSIKGLDKKSITNEIKKISSQKYNYSFSAVNTHSISKSEGNDSQIEKVKKIEKTEKNEKANEELSSSKQDDKIVPITIPTQTVEKIGDPPKVEMPQIIKINTSNTIAPGKTATWATLGSNWTVVNTKIDVATYATTAYNKGIRQDSNSARYGNLCMAFSYVHASNLYNGSTQDNAESAYNWKHASEFKDIMSDNKSDILNAIYYEIMNGRPCVVQVNGNVKGTSRHFATVVGIKDTVKSAQDLTEDDLLIIDSWDCKVERMDTETSRFLTNGMQTGNGYTGYYLRVLKT